MFPGTRSVPLGFQNISDLSAAVGLTVPDTKPKPDFAVLVAETAAVRWRDDGVAPTSSDGMLLAVGVEFVYTGNLEAIKFIAATGSPALDVSYYKNAG